jgi:hypothetical protein
MMESEGGVALEAVEEERTVECAGASMTEYAEARRSVCVEVWQWI